MALAVATATLLVAAAPSHAAKKTYDPQQHILGGSFASINQTPYMAGVFFKGRYGCSGSVITPRHVLTAAHCIVGSAPNFSVVTGRTNLADASSGQAIPVIQTFVSPDYATGRGKIRGHDLAVLALASPTASPTIGVATEAEGAALTTPGTALGAAGWGATTPFQKRVSVTQLKTTTMRVVANKRCKPYRKAFRGGSMICTSGPKLRPGKRSLRTSVCAGDSGGPLVGTGPDGAPRVVGTVSYGPQLCGLPFQPVVYGRAFDTTARTFIGGAAFTPLPPPQ